MRASSAAPKALSQVVAALAPVQASAAEHAALGAYRVRIDAQLFEQGVA
ncbi:hypothetical protein LP419_11990 [Massilia sp. H-1]|nr:hypothetical protein LP419_11990 [Massilia sp. H-1]